MNDLELDEEDEKILDGVWAKIGSTEKEAQDEKPSPQIPSV